MPPLIGNNGAPQHTTGSVLMSGIDTQRKTAELLDTNLTSKDVNGYVTREARVLSDGLGGVKLSELEQRIDKNLITEIRKQSSQVCCTDSMEKYYQDILAFFGGKGDKSSLTHIGEEMSSALKVLEKNPGTANFTTDALRGLKDHAKSITDLASKISNLQDVIGREIANSVDKTNNCLSEIVDLNKKINSATDKSEQFTYVDERRIVYQALAEQLGIRIVDTNPNEHLIFDNNNNILLQGDYISKLNYNDLNGNSALTIDIFDTRVVDISTTIQENSQTGKLAGLKRMRDTVLPNLQAQLDEYTRALRDKFNSIHNLGVSMDPPSVLTGTIGVPGAPNLTPDTIISGIGTVRIGSADPSTGNLVGYTDISLTDNMTVHQLMDSINNANPNSGITASITNDGRFQLQTVNSSCGVVIGSVGDQVASLSASSAYTANMSANLSHFFGLNNLFQTGDQGLGGILSRISDLFSLRPDIVNSLGIKIACGKLSNAPIPVTRVLNRGDVGTISLLAEAYNDSNTLFNKTPLSPATKTSLSSFADSIVDIQKKDVERITVRLKNERSLYTGLSKKASDISSVNKDTVLFELTKINERIDMLSKAMILSNQMNNSIMNIK